MTVNWRIAGIALTILILSVTPTLSGQQHQILPLPTGRPASLTAGDDLRPHTVTSSPSYALAADQPLTVSLTFTPSRPVVGKPVTLNATASSGTAPYTFVWSFGDDTNSTGNPVTHTYTGATSYAVSLNVTDDVGDTTSANISIIVKPSNLPPIPIFTMTPPLSDLFAGDQIFFDGGSQGLSRDQDPDGGAIVSFLWLLGDGTSQTGAGAILHTYSSPGGYEVKLSVTDNSGEERSTKQWVWVRPALTLTMSSNITQGLAPLFISFRTQLSGGRFPFTFSWDFGDGQISTRPSPRHNYTIPGVYQVEVLVTDALGHTASRDIDITVAARPFSLTVLGLSEATLKIGGALTLLSVFPLIIFAAVRRRKHGSSDDS